MASTANTVPSASNASGNAVNSSSQNPGVRPSLRPKASDAGRRQSGSPLEGGQRRSNSQKAWFQGNPITQRSSYSQQNGNMSQRGRPSSKETNTSDNHAHDRLVFLLTGFIGLPATVTTRSGEVFTGIFSSSSLEPSDTSFVLKMVQRPSKPEQPKSNGVSEPSVPFLGPAPDHSMLFDAKEVVDISVQNVSTSEVTAKAPSGASSGFRTDADISGNLAMRERTLQKWEPSAETEVDLSLESANDGGGWDQFETNERLFGAASTYDENLYTTRIDRSDPTYKQKEAEAARIAREIEGTSVDNVHVMEERGQAPTGDGGDEEEKYSGVRRDEKNFPPLVSGQPNKYTPPARRQAVPQQPPTAAPADFGKQPAVASKDAPTSAAVSAKEAVPSQAQASNAAASGAIPDAEQKAAPAKTQTGAAPASKRAAPKTGGTSMENEVLNHFRQFAGNERRKLQEHSRNKVDDRSVKLNELMKFSQNFKLATPVPKDLVPILAKDRTKQEEIIHRAQGHADDKPSPSPSSSKGSPAPSAEQKPATRTPGAARYDSGTMPPANQSGFSRGRPMVPPTGPHAGARLPHHTIHPNNRQAGMLGHRLADNLQQRKGTAAMGPVPTPLPIQDLRNPPSGPAGDQSGVSSPSKAQTPTSASAKFNAKALEFKPNPAASTFTPGASSNSSPFVRNRSVSRATSPSAFFGEKKPRPITERPSLNDQFNPIKRTKKEIAENPETKDHFTFNGGIPQAYRTPPTWDVAPGNEEKTYQQMFKHPAVPVVSPQHRSASNPNMPQPQMPFQFPQGTPGMPPVSGPPQGPHLHPQQHHGSGPAHFDDPHRMQMSASTSQMYPSPRLQPGYPSPMVPHAQLAFGQTMPQFYVNQPGAPQPAHMRQYPGAPQFMNPQGAMGAPMMVQQPSTGPYIGVPQGMAPYSPQMQMYSPNPGHAYPSHPPPQPHSGYPSPRGAPMMMHQNSQPGQPPMYMPPGQHGQPVYGAQQPGHVPPPVRGNYPQQQPHFQSSPHQAHHFPPHQHRTPSSSYNQMPQVPHQGPSQPPPAAASGAQPSEATEESK